MMNDDGELEMDYRYERCLDREMWSFLALNVCHVEAVGRRCSHDALW